MHVLAMFGNGGGLLFRSYCVNVRVCNLHSLHHTGHIGSYKLHMYTFIYDRWLCFFHIQFLFNFPAGKSNLNDCAFLFFGVYFNSHKMANIDEFPYGVLGPHASSNSEKKLKSFGSCVYVLRTTSCSHRF